MATPEIRSALAIIRVSGPRSIAVTATFTSIGDRLIHAPTHTIHRATMTNPETGAAIDTVVLLLYRTPHSYSGEDTVEICCHGNPRIAQAIVRLYHRHGIEMATPGEFTLQAVMNGKLDLTQAEAVAEVVAAEGGAAREGALARLNGSLKDEIDTIKQRLKHVVAGINIQLDYPVEESGDISVDVAGMRFGRAALQRLIAGYKVGRLESRGIAAVLMGKTNSGKSSLFNRLIREERAIVSSQHGTTRDYIEAQTEVNGIPVRLFDTAGTRETAHQIEQEGMARTQRLSVGAHIILYVVDGTKGMNSHERAIIQKLRGGTSENRQILVVYNKSDLHSPAAISDAPAVLPNPPAAISDAPAVLPAPPSCPVVHLSAKTGDGIDRLIAELERAVTPQKLLREAIPSSAHAALPISSDRQVNLLRQAESALAHAEQRMAAGVPLDMLSLDIEEALNALGQITGEVSTAEMLTEMFSGFCVGK